MVVQQFFYKLDHTTKAGDNRLGSDPRLYAAMVYVGLLLRGVHVKMARTASDANIFLDAVRTVDGGDSKGGLGHGKRSPRALGSGEAGSPEKKKIESSPSF